MNRDQIIGAAFRKVVGAQTLSPPQLLIGTQQLNLIVQEEDARGQSRQNRQLWATARDSMPLKAARQVYTTAMVNSTYAIPSAIAQLERVVYRDATGDDTPLTIVNVDEWQLIENKDEGGDPCKVWLEENRDLTAQRLWIWPTPATITDGNEVSGTDGLNYVCIQSHSASSPKRPTTGAQWPAYWAQKTAIATNFAWSAAATYVAAPSLLITYKRPLVSFVNATDLPDFPAAWERFLVYRLAHELSSDYGLSLEERQALKTEFTEARDLLFPGTRPVSDSIHDKGCFF